MDLSLRLRLLKSCFALASTNEESLSEVKPCLLYTSFAFPGMGKMLIDSIKASNNTMVVGLVFIFTVLAVFGAMAGDILMVMVDPRIKLTTKKGGK